MHYFSHSLFFLRQVFIACATLAGGIFNIVHAQIALPKAYDTSLRVNYIRTWDANAPVTDASLLVTLPITSVKLTAQFYDGLGNPLQTVTRQMSPSKKDMVTSFVYDNMQRERYKYLPFVSNVLTARDTVNNGYFKIDAFQEDSAFNKGQFPGENYYYSQVDYEKSPLGRPLKVYAPGNSWVGGGRGIASQYLISEVADSVQLWTIGPGIGSLPVHLGTYQPGQLYKNITSDEHNHQVTEYKDKEGLIVLRKVQLTGGPGTGHAGWLNTYYIYDTLQNLRFILPPRLVELVISSWSVSQQQADELAFRYEYDTRKRMIEKKVPGSGETWMVYDADNRLVMSQDSNLRVQGKWLVTEYDVLNRPWRTGLLTDTNSRIYHQNLAQGSTTYPYTGGSNYEILTRSYYDDYSWTSAVGLSSTLIPVSNSGLITTYNSSPLYAQPIAAMYQTRGLVTGTMTKVVGTSQYLYSVSFFDDHGRVIQEQSINYTGAKDTLTTQYDFSGKVLRTLLLHQKAQNTHQYHSVLTKISYDSAGRMLTVRKNIDNASTDQLIDSLQYNELGQVQKTFLGNKLDSLSNTYNIRGWLTGINKTYVGGGTSNYFGLELAYDQTSSVTGSNYLAAQFNGNITGLTWKSKGDTTKRKYNFTYDTTNRLTGAAFIQNDGTGWSNGSVDYTVSGLNYDANGNILKMNQKGLKLNSSSTIDSLNYGYYLASNKLYQVREGANDTASLLGDFHYKGTQADTAYRYDGNGNLVKDSNKGIDTIIYNYLNLPQQVHFVGKGSILYTYDAAGNKLTKVTLDSTAKHSTRTLYQAGFVYQQTDSITNPGGRTDTLQFLLHEEGRARWAFHKFLNGDSAYRWDYDFFEKDHLGNTRVILTQEKDTAIYAATMENKSAAKENLLFNNVSSTQYPTPSGFEPSSGADTSNHFVSRLNGGSGGNRIGPSIVLKVMAQDTVSATVYGWYSGPVQAPPSPESPLINDLLSTLTGDIIGQSAGKLAGATSPVNSVLTAVMPTFMSVKDANYNASQPKAFLNWVLFDNQLNYVTGGVTQMPLISAGVSKQVMQATIPVVVKNGYLYIYASNESAQDVFFDNLNIQFKTGPLLEETHYYPFGLTMAGISDKALKGQYAENKIRFQKQELQSKEFSDGSGLEMYEFKYRMDDPQIGRFWSIDPLANKYVYNSTYAFSENHVTIDVELEGLEMIHVNSDPNVITYGSGSNQATVSLDVLNRKGESKTTPSNNSVKKTPNNGNDGSKPLVGTSSTTKVTKEYTTGSMLGTGTVTVSNTTAVTKGNEGSIVTLDVVHKQTNDGVEAEGVGGSLGPLNATYGFDGSFSIGTSIKDEESGLDIHASFGVGAMNGNGVFSAGITSKEENGVSTSTDVSYTPGLSGVGVAGLFILSTFQPEVSIPFIKALPKVAPAQ
jgi:RHS repeat-associated protein